jgi:hypothetical protein
MPALRLVLVLESGGRGGAVLATAADFLRDEDLVVRIVKKTVVSSFTAGVFGKEVKAAKKAKEERK